MGCIKLHILDEQYKSTELKISYFNKELTENNSVENPRRWILVNRVDPTGMDWYQDNNGGVIWYEGSDERDGYMNIGTTYTMDIGSGTSMTYTQNELTSITYTGADESSWESQITNKTNCYQASSQMLQNEEVTTAGRNSEILMTALAPLGRAGDASTNADNGVAVIDQALEIGNPIIVGVDYKNGSPNADKMTDHFVVVSSKTETINNGYVTSTVYNFFGPRTSHQNYGTSTNNQFTRNNSQLTGAYNHGGSNFNYVVTTVRRNR